MGKTITSPVQGWEGTIVLYDPLTLPQAIALEDAGVAVSDYLLKKLEKEGFEPSLEQKNFEKAVKKGFVYSINKRNQLFWPALRQCIQEWHIEAFVLPDDDTFPARPSEKSREFLNWLLDEVQEANNEPEEIKNE